MGTLGKVLFAKSCASLEVMPFIMIAQQGEPHEIALPGDSS